MNVDISVTLTRKMFDIKLVNLLRAVHFSEMSSYWKGS
jgi:hypothetical protein